MREHLSLALTIIVLMFSPTKAQIKESPFYANQNPGPALLDNVQLAQYAMPKGNEITDVDAHQILEPVMRPFVTMFDVMQQNAKAHKYAEKVQQERDSSPFSNSKSIFDLFEKLQRPTTTPTPAPSLVQQLFQPYLEPWQRQLDSISKEMAGITLLPPTTTPAPTTTPQRSLLERSLGMFFPSFTERRPTPAPSTTTPEPAREIRRSPARLFDPENPITKIINSFSGKMAPEESKQLTLPRLLESLAKNTDGDRVRSGTEQALSVLGMPLGKRKEFPFDASSFGLGKKDFFGAVDSNSNPNNPEMNWALVERISSMVREGSQAFGMLHQQLRNQNVVR